ncbi:MAG: hypothetical protein IT206_02515 [Fimbriimonadaceae bacterium]|nr:hypothetical protein [Fimbriimonadaceae bacterium]
MIWLQATVCLFVWLAYGLYLRTRSDSLRMRLQALSRNQLILRSISGFVLSAAIMLTGLWGISACGGLSAKGLNAWSWPAVGVLGLVFVHIQVLSAAAMIVIIQRDN